MKKKYEKPAIFSDKIELNILHTACTAGNKTINPPYSAGYCCSYLGCNKTGNLNSKLPNC